MLLPLLECGQDSEDLVTAHARTSRPADILVVPTPLHITTIYPLSHISCLACCLACNQGAQCPPASLPFPVHHLLPMSTVGDDGTAVPWSPDGLSTVETHHNTLPHLGRVRECVCHSLSVSF